MPITRDATLGFSVHTGWAAMVTISGPLEKPEVVDRRRIELLGAEDDMARFVYHNAAELKSPAARILVNTTTKAVRRKTLTCLVAAVHEMEKRGLRVTRAGVIGIVSRPPGALDAILASHAAIHTAEGELYRGAIATACETLGLAVRWLAANELAQVVAAQLGKKATTVETYVSSMKRVVGPPWGLDQKQAMTAAWSALAGDSKKSPAPRPARRAGKSR